MPLQLFSRLIVGRTYQVADLHVICKGQWQDDPLDITDTIALVNYQNSLDVRPPDTRPTFEATEFRSVWLGENNTVFGCTDRTVTEQSEITFLGWLPLAREK